VASTDVADVGQVDQASATTLAQADAYASAQSNAALTAANAYTDQRFAQASSRAASGTAAAMAMAGLAQAVTPGKSMVTGGVGVWNGQTGLAFGLSHRMDDGRWTVKAGATFAMHGDAGASAAVGYEF
jgi:autotransporter adhesin